MCKPASFIVSRRKVWFHPTNDNHTDIIDKYGIAMEGARGVNAVPVEISPDDGDLSRPLDEWVFLVDVAGIARDLPSWWDAEREERRARAALVDWAEARLTGWRVHEAFHPVHPFQRLPEQMAPERIRELVGQWASVQASVRVSARDSVRDSVGDSMGESVWGSVWGSVGASVRDSVGESVWGSVWGSVRDSVWVSARDSVRDSVGDSMGESVWGSVWGSVGAYVGSLFPNIAAWRGTAEQNPWDSLRELWLSGRVPLFDGIAWRVHVGPDGQLEMCVNLEEEA